MSDAATPETELPTATPPEDSETESSPQAVPQPVAAAIEPAPPAQVAPEAAGAEEVSEVSDASQGHPPTQTAVENADQTAEKAEADNPDQTNARTETEPEVNPEESFGQIFSEFQRTHSRREGDDRQIRGTVVAVTADSVLVDIGFKSEGTLPLVAFSGHRVPPRPGDTLLVSVKGRDADGYYELSLFRTAQPRDWSALERAFEDKSTIVGRVTGVVKGGLHVDVGVRAFLPASRSGARDAAELEKLVGEEIRCRITKLDTQEEDVVVDRRVVLEQEALEGKARRYAQLEEGAVLDGTVRSIASYGAFVDLGGVDGLLHIGDIAWTRVDKVEDVLAVGQQIEVKVLRIDPETRKIGLGLKQLQPEPWQAVPAKYAAGDKVRGVVTRTTDFGAFVELEPGVEGLIHLSEMSWSRRIFRATEVMQAGDVVEAAIVSISVPERRISLSLKQALGDPWTEAAARLVPGAVVEGPVASITRYGAFVTVAEGVEGMIHISEIVADRRLNHPSDVLHTGQVVKAQVLAVDREKRQLKLSMKQLIPTGLDEFLKENAVGDKVSGRVVSVENGVAQVEVGEGIVYPVALPKAAAAQPVSPEPAAAGKVDLSAFSSMLKTRWKTGSSEAAGVKPAAEAVKAGQVRSFRITALDAAAKSVHLELIP
jgi:small subunit ribosomal protein S1